MNMIKRFMLAIMLAVPISIVASQSTVNAFTNFDNGVGAYGVEILPGIGGNIFSGAAYWVDSGNSNAADGGGGPDPLCRAGRPPSVAGLWRPAIGGSGGSLV